MAAIFSPALPRDGRWNATTVKAMQRYLKYKGFYPSSKYVIDGDDGPATWKAIMNYMSDYHSHIGTITMYSGWVPYHSPKVWDEIGLLQWWLNDHRFPVIQA